MALSDFEKYLRSASRLQDRDNKMVEKRLAKMFLDSYAIAESQIADLYAKLGKDMTIVDAQKFNRLATIMKSIEKEYTALTKNVISTTGKTSADNFIEAFYKYNWGVAQASGAAISFGVVPIASVRASVNSVASGLNYVSTIKKNAFRDLSRIQAEITRGIATGRGYVKTASGLKDMFTKGFNDALRVVRTEAHRNYTEGFLEAHDTAVDLGIDVKKMWVASLDDRTRDTHIALDGEYADENGLFHIGSESATGPGLFNVPEEDINCRCTLVDVIAEMPPKFRRSKEDGVIPYQTYPDWAGAKGWTPEDGWPKVDKV